MKALFIGLGSIGQRHLRNLIQLNPDTEVSAVRRTRTAPLLSEANQVIPGKSVSDFYRIHEFSNLDSALLDKPDLVFITNPTNLHSRVALKVLESDAFLFIEKPLSHNLQGAKQLINKEQMLGRKRCLVGFQFRFHPALLYVKSIINDGKLGKLVSARLVNGEFMPGWHPYEDYRQSYAARKELGGGALLTQIHDFDYAQWLFGMPDQLFAVGGKLSSLDINVEDSVHVLMSCRANGNPLPVSISLDYLQWPAQRGFSVVGEDGRIECDLITNTVVHHDRIKNKSKVINFNDFTRNKMFVEQMQNFLDFSDGKALATVDLSEGVKSLAIATAANTSLISTKSVFIPEIVSATLK